MTFEEGVQTEANLNSVLLPLAAGAVGSVGNILSARAGIIDVFIMLRQRLLLQERHRHAYIPIIILGLPLTIKHNYKIPA